MPVHFNYNYGSKMRHTPKLQGLSSLELHSFLLFLRHPLKFYWVFKKCIIGFYDISTLPLLANRVGHAIIQGKTDGGVWNE